MKVKTAIACAAVAAALPLGSAWAVANATTLGGPQGTGYYGTVDPLTDRRDMAAPEERGAASAGAGTERAQDLNRDGVISPSEQAAATDTRRERRDSYSGPSWATNPPAPSQ
ncbi:MAG TPA: hypothetical protein VFZ81_15740 [Burkholderiales bacterium]